MKSLLVFFLCLVTSSVFAQEYAKLRFYTQVLPTNYYETQEAACTASGQKVASTSGTLQSAIVSYAAAGNNALGTCHVKFTPFNNTGTGVASNAISAQYSCPAGMTVGNSTTNIYQRPCLGTCPADTTLNATTGKCDDNCLPNKGKIAEFSINCGGSEPSRVCMPNGCAANISSSFTVQTGGCSYGVMSGPYTGSKCASEVSSTSLSNPSNANPPPADSPPTDCIKQGKSFGTVNGVVVCVPKSSAGAAPVKQTNTSTTTSTNTDAAGNTSSSTSSEVKNATQDGDQVTSTTTKTNADGSKTEETKTESTFQFCATNPTHPICKKPASEEEEGVDPCEDNPDLPQCLALGQAEEGGAIATSNKTVSFAPVQITSGGSCPPDKSVSIAGRSITFSYSWLCQYASMFKPFMLAFAYLSAAMFLFMGLRGANT